MKSCSLRDNTFTQKQWKHNMITKWERTHFHFGKDPLSIGVSYLYFHILFLDRLHGFWLYLFVFKVSTCSSYPGFSLGGDTSRPIREANLLLMLMTIKHHDPYIPHMGPNNTNAVTSFFFPPFRLRHLQTGRVFVGENRQDGFGRWDFSGSSIQFLTAAFQKKNSVSTQREISWRFRGKEKDLFVSWRVKSRMSRWSHSFFDPPIAAKCYWLTFGEALVWSTDKMLAFMHRKLGT